MRHILSRAASMTFLETDLPFSRSSQVRFWSPEDMQWSTWSSCFGFLVSVLSFFLWRSQQRAAELK